MVFPLKVNKVWGHEIIFANDPEKGYCGKMLYIENNFCTSMHMHPIKDEVFYITTGGMYVETAGTDPEGPGDIEKVLLLPKDRFHIPTGTWHRISATSQGGRYSSLVEVSTYHDDADVLRAEASGRVNPL